METIKIKGFKGFEKGLKCKGKQYQEHTLFKEDVTPLLCDKGLHFCKNPLDVFHYYPPKTGIEYAEVQSEGEIDKGEDKISRSRYR